MKKLGFISLFVALALLGLAALPACSLGSAAAPTTTSTQTAVVKKGDLTVDITASGNLALSRTADLAFDMAGYVQNVNVELGDNVSSGEVLATLDTSAWEDQITSLQRALTSAQRKLTAAQQAVTTAERGVTTAQQTMDTNVTSKQTALTQQQINLKNAQIALEKAQDTYSGLDVETAQANVDKAATYLQYALDQRAAAGGANSAMWDKVVSKAQSDYDAAKAALDELITQADSDEIAILKMQLNVAQANYDAADSAVKQATDDGTVSVQNAQTALDNDKAAVEDAQNAANDAQHNLDEAKSTHPQIVAPFDGFVSLVNVAGGDEVYKGKVAVQIADPTRFEANILVSEMDISKVSVGGTALVQPSANTAMVLPAKVTKIAPTATISSGVVNYAVTVELNQIPASSTVQGSSSTSSLPTQLPPVTTTTTGGQGRTSTSGQAPRAQINGLTGNFQVRQGLTVTVSLIVQQKTGILLVPNQAIIKQGQNNFVQVVKDGATTQVAVKTGISNWQYTEVTEGISEGDTVILQKSTSTSTTQQRSGPVFMGPGIGR